MMVLQTNINAKTSIPLDLCLFRFCLSYLKGFSSLLDVACGAGLYSVIAKKEFKLNVTATDARLDRVPINQFKELGVVFKNIEVEGTIDFNFDIILLSGIFYHLDLSQQFELLMKIGRAKCKYLIINTHICNKSSETFFKLHKIEIGTIVGGVYTEGSNRMNRPMASVNNYFSFWHTLESLDRLFLKFGFKNILLVPYVTDNRMFIISKRA